MEVRAADNGLSAEPAPGREGQHPRGAVSRARVVWRWLKIVVLLAGLAFGAALADAWVSLGTRPSGARLERMARSAQYRGGKFVDTIPRIDPDIGKAGKRWLRGVEHNRPEQPLPLAESREGAFASPPRSGLRITWFGHSTLLVEIEGQNVLIDPIWSERCSPSRVMGPRRFHPPPLPLEALPRIDFVLISHDHYDHLDYRTIMRLFDSKARFLVPLGVGAHLEYWGLDPARLEELDWWEQRTFGGLSFVATPARHFSGRGLQRDGTLWAGWAILGAERRAYYSGDTAMFEGFSQVGERYGPFDAAMIEVGAYDQMWADVHLGPEQAIEAHRAVRARVLFPVHWGTFDLALHSWVEPIERVLVAAERSGVQVVTPKPGQSIEPLTPPSPERWWPPVPWRNAAEAPVVSSGLERLK